MTTYAELLRDPRWQKKRLKILKRDKWACRACAAFDCSLHVHHLIYIAGKAPWDYGRNHLVTLCKDCHELAHQGKVPLIRPNPHSSREMGCNLRRMRRKRNG